MSLQPLTPTIVVTYALEAESQLHTLVNTSITSKSAKWHLFVDKIMNAKLSPKWKGLSINWYDGTTDLDEHVDVYVTQTCLYTSDDAVLCHVFHISKKGSVESVHPPSIFLYRLFWNLGSQIWNVVQNKLTTPPNINRSLHHPIKEGRVIKVLHGEIQESCFEYSKP